MHFFISLNRLCRRTPTYFGQQKSMNFYIFVNCDVSVFFDEWKAQKNGIYLKYFIIVLIVFCLK